MPLRLTIDLVALDRQDHEGLGPVVSLVEYIVERRRGPTTGVLRLRAADVHLLAETYGETRSQLALRLLNANVLTDL